MTELTYAETDARREEALRDASRRAFDAILDGRTYEAALILSDFQPFGTGIERLTASSLSMDMETDRG